LEEYLDCSFVFGVNTEGTPQKREGMGRGIDADHDELSGLSLGGYSGSLQGQKEIIPPAFFANYSRERILEHLIQNTETKISESLSDGNKNFDNLPLFE
jgi:hypothetical protein